LAFIVRIYHDARSSECPRTATTLKRARKVSDRTGRFNPAVQLAHFVLYILFACVI